MNFDSEIWLVAKNITDFLRVLCTDRSILFNNFKTVDAYLKSVKEQEVEMKEQMSKPALQRLKEVFSLDGIPDMVDYMRSVREDRCQAICIQTLDTVGIVPLSYQTNQAAGEPLSIDWDDERGLDVLLQEASTETKLAIIRDAQHKKRFPDERMMLRRCKNILTELGMHHELYNLMEITD